MNRTNHLQEAIALLSKANSEQQVQSKRYPLPESVSDLVENDIRDAAFELVAITKAIFGWALEQKELPMGGGILDMDSGDIVSLSDMAIRRAQRIVDLSNMFESKVTSVGVKA